VKCFHALCLAALLCLTSAVQGQDGSAADEYTDMVLEEVIVTAEKRGEQNMLDVAMSISAIDGDEMRKRNLQGMNDYLRSEPGTNFIDRGTGRNSVIIRGITSDPGRGGVITGVYIDETPVQGLGLYETGSPDLALVDVERVEILRGPQGTLYGAGSMSGTIRTLTRAPELDAFGGYVKLGGSVTAGNGGNNNDIQAVLNLPLAEERFAIRVVAYRFDDSGYIRNVAASDPAKLAGVELFNARLSDSVEHRGGREIEGYRLGALWRVNDRLDIRFTAMGQQTDQDGVPTIDVLQGDYEQSRYARLDGSDEGMAGDLDLYSLTLNYDAENWSLVSASAWIKYEASIDWDVGLFFLDALDGIEPPMFIFQADENEVFTQELRWSWDAGGRWRALAGVFYEKREFAIVDSNHFEGFPDPFEGFFEFYGLFESERTQKSIFADVTVGLTDHLEVSAGYRHYDIDGGGFNSSPDDAQSGETLKAGLNWRPEMAFLGENPLFYALWAEGFRPGFEVGKPPDRCDPDGDGIIDEVGLPWQNVDTDDVSSIEVGYKANFAQRRVSVEAAAFKIDWTGIRLDIVVPAPCASTLPFNAGAAESKGFEFALSALVTERLQLHVSASWVNAQLSEDGLLGSAGSRLPGSPEFNASLGLEYGFELGGNRAWVRGDAAYVGDYYNTLEETPPRIGDYTTVNLSSGIDFDRWSLEVFVTNLTDSDALTWANPIWAPYDRETRLQPRTIGARLGYRFGEGQ
jgi:iron complex outermembrane receptor protein